MVLRIVTLKGYVSKSDNLYRLLILYVIVLLWDSDIVFFLYSFYFYFLPQKFIFLALECSARVYRGCISIGI